MRTPHVAAPVAACVAATLALAATAAASHTPCHERAGSPWCDASLSPDARAGVLLDAMALEEKFELMAGDDPIGVFSGNPANGTSHGVPRLGIPTVYFNDGPAGVREGESTGMPAPIALAATWNPSAAHHYGAVVGNENRNKGNHVIHAPAVNIMRAPEGGRTFEYFGEDPLLSARLGVPWTRGAQGEGVLANVKHYAANNQETDRFLTNAIVDERTLREIYLPAFEANVTQGRVATVMLAYNRVNGTYATENAPLVRDILKREWGFEGFTLTDYGFAQRSTAESSNAGNDLEMPQEGWYSEPALRASVESGRIPVAEIDDHVRRILRQMFRFGHFDSEPPPDNGEIDELAHRAVADEVSEDAMVLLRNTGVLPLDPAKVRSIAVIGPKADEYKNGGGSSNVTPFRKVTPLDGIRERATREGIEVTHAEGLAPTEAADAARAADVAIVVVNDNQTEFADRPCLSLACGDPASGDQDGMVRAAAAANPNTIVVSETGGSVLMPWSDAVAAILQAWYPGQEGGHAIARVLFGDADPGGRLPLTFPRSAGDPATANRPDRYPGIAFDAEYSEGVFVGYRHNDENGIEPRFAFGHGLSYTHFSYSRPRIVRHRRGRGGITVAATVRNTGARRGTEVVQVYLGMPETDVPQPPRWLRGFRKLRLAAGRAKRVRIRLTDRELSYWDAGGDDWRVSKGCYRVEVARSSRDVELTRRFSIGRPRCR